VARGRLGHAAPHASNYKMRNVVQELGIKYLFNSTSVINKMKSLRPHFYREHSKMLIKKSGSSTDEMYMSRWFVYKHLLFIVESDDAREGKDTIITLEESLVSLCIWILLKVTLHNFHYRYFVLLGHTSFVRHKIIEECVSNFPSVSPTVSSCSC